MLDFFNTLFTYISILFDTLLNVLEGIFQFLSFIPNILQFTTSLTTFVPSFLVPFLTSAILLAVVLKVINRKE